MKLNRAQRRQLKRKGHKINMESKRTIEQVNAEYTQLCQHIGDLSWKVELAKKDLDAAYARIAELSKEGEYIRRNEADAPKEESTEVNNVVS